MGALHVIKQACIKALDGYTADEIRSLCIRANNMGILARKGKYTDAKTAIMVIGHDRIIDRLTTFLGFPRRKCSFRSVETIDGGGKGVPPVAPSEVVDEARAECLLAKIAGSSVGAQLDIKRECLPSDSSIEEFQGKKQIQHVVPSDSVERMQPSPSIQAN
jgi:hypothetical protein